MLMLMQEKELLDLMESHKEIVVFGAGLCGSVLVRYLTAKKYAERIFCVAVSHANGNPDNLMGVPVCALADIRDRGASALAVIAAFPKLHEEMYGALENTGFQNIVALSSVCYAEIRRACPDYSAESYSDTRRIQAKLQEMDSKLTSLAYRIAEQQEIASVNTVAFEKYKNIHSGKELVIVATGSTLNDYDPIEGAVHIGMNTVYKYRKLALDYYFAQDFNRETIGKYYGENHLERYIQDIVELQCKKFIGRYLQDCPHKFIQLSESALQRMNASVYYVDTSPSREIHTNICFHPLMDYFSIVFPVVHFALFTNPRRIYLVGCDLSDGGQYKHFDGENFQVTEWLAAHIEIQKKQAWPKIKAFAAQYYPDTEIVSVNPVGLKGFFRDVYTKRDG
jgi:hypothetical protein